MPEKLPNNVLLQAFEEADTSGIDDLAEKLSGDRFESKKLSGEGGAKEIFKVKDLVTGRQLALAYPRGNSKDDYELILREARLHSLLEHPNIVRLYDIGLDEQKPFFTMKYVDGFTLEKYISKIPEGRVLDQVQINDLLDIFLKICDAISYSHSKSISHLDLKPSNIFLDDHGEVLVGDWGLARIANEPDKTFELPLEQDYGQTTLYGYINGTPGYMAPEQCTKGIEKGPLSDIYSLGAVLVFMFCHRPPVKGDEDERILATVEGNLLFDLQCMPESIQHITLKALNTKPEERYQSVRALIQDIQKYRSGFMTSAEPSSFNKQLRLFIQRNKFVSSLIILFLAAISILTLIYIENVKKSERETRKALIDLQKSQKVNEELNKKRAAEAYQKSLDLYQDKQQGRFSYDSYKNELAFSAIELSLSLNENLAKSWLLKGKLCLLLERWEEAEYAFYKSGNEKYLNLSKSIDILERKSAAKVLLLIDSLQDGSLTKHYIFKSTYNRNSIENYGDFCQVALGVLNKGLTDLHFKYNEEELSLDLSGNTKLENIYPIRTMRIYSLNISGCKSIKTYDYLKELPLKKLDASNSSLTNRDFRSLENHVISYLNVSYCDLERLNPVLNMPLKKLDVRGLSAKAVTIIRKAGNGMEIICSENAFELLDNYNKSLGKNWTLTVK